MKRKWFSWLLRLTVSALLIGYFVFNLANRYDGIHGAWLQFVHVFSGARPIWLLAALGLMMLGYSLLTLRWKVLLAAQDHYPPYKRLFRFYIMSTFFNNFLPSTIGGDALRVAQSRRDSSRGAMSLMVVLIERLSGLAALTLIAAAGVLVDGPLRTSRNRFISMVILAMTVLAVLSVVLAHPRPASRWLPRVCRMLPAGVGSRIQSAIESLWVYYRHPASLGACLGISLVFQLNMVVYYWVIARTLNRTPDFADFMLNIPIMVFLLMVVPAINGLGVRTAGFRTLMRFPAAFALAAEFVDLGFRIMLGLLGGLVFVFSRRSQR